LKLKEMLLAKEKGEVLVLRPKGGGRPFIPGALEEGGAASY